MIYTHVPGRPLADLVERFWLDDDFRPRHAAERVLPTGTLDLVVDLSPGAGRNLLASGAHASHFDYRTTGIRAVLGVAFRPGGAAPFLGVPAGDLRDAVVPMHELWGSAADDLGMRLAAAAPARLKFECLEEALLARLGRAPRRHPAVCEAVRLFGAGVEAPSVAAVARRVGLGPRRLIRAFRAEVGLPPKLYCRVRRFGEVLGAAGRAERVGWAAVAQACGYCDQSHLVRDFRRFAGLCPSAYMAARGDNPFHLPAPA